MVKIRRTFRISGFEQTDDAGSVIPMMDNGKQVGEVILENRKDGVYAVGTFDSKTIADKAEQLISIGLKNLRRY